MVDNRVYIADGYWGLTVVDVSSIPFADSGCKLTNPILKNGSFTFTFSTATNAQYIVESTAGLNPSSWRPLGTNAGTGGAVAFTQTNTATAAGFYRVQVTAQ